MNPDQVILDNFIDKHPFSAAHALERLEEKDVAAFMEELPIEKSLKLLELMNNEKAANCFAFLSAQLTETLLENGDVSFAESICRHLNPQSLENLLARISHKKATAIRQILEQKPNTVGVSMVPAIVVNKEMVVHEAVEIVKRNKENLESYLYIADLNGAFEGGVKLKELLLADRNMILEELMITEIPRFLPETPLKNVLNHPAWYEYRYIPVINRSNRLLGTLPYRMVKDTPQKENRQSTEEILETGSALGELYLLGLTGLLQSFRK